SAKKHYSTALHNYHIKHGFPWSESKCLQCILTGVNRMAPKSSRRPLRPPLNACMVNLLIHNLELDQPLNAAVAACASVAFRGQCCLGELLRTLSHNTADSRIPRCHNLRQSLRNSKSWILCLPETKICRQGENVILVQQTSTSNPLLLLPNHLKNNPMPGSINLFAYNSQRGVKNLTKRCFLDWCNEIWGAHGIPRITGHSFCISSTTKLLLAGVPPDVVKALGHWSSDTFLQYWRSVDDLAPMHTANLLSRTKNSNNSKHMVGVSQ
ncbi:hypothetical protein FA15DRAFT_606225, partial [Coprinopsis marcescibilis]